MEESLFTSKPRSLKMDRRSPEAARLQETVSKKLLDFLGNYSDDVIAEYIVVLVCNGKHQNQARDDLHAFLGEESGTFVTWLWDHLSKEFILKMTPDFSDPDAKGTANHSNRLDKEYKNSIIADDDAHLVGPPKTVNGSLLPSCHANSDNLKPPQLSERLQPCPSKLYDRITKVNMERLKVPEISLRKSSGSKGDNFTADAKNISSSITSSHEVSHVGKQPLSYELQDRKIPKDSSGTVPSQHLPEPKAQQTAISLRSVIAEEHQLRPSSSRNSAETRLPSTAVDDLFYQTAPLRGNVWDRLGIPHVEDKRPIKEEQSRHLDLTDSGQLDHQGEVHQNPWSTRISSVGNSASSFNRKSYAVDRGDSEGISVKLAGECRTSDEVDNASKLKRKGEACEFNTNNGSFCKVNYLQHKEHSQQQRQSLPVKQNSQHSMNKFSRVSDRSVASDAKIGLINPSCTGLDSKATVVSQSQGNKNSVTSPMENLVPVSTTLPVNSNHLSRTDSGNANQKPVQEDVHAVKLRLRQIEMDMLRLRSKQVGRSTDGKQNASSVFQPNNWEEGIESRTVLVENVHFAATRESLISHFGKCGTIAKVVMLTDAVTALPKGAAYIVFANKESVDRAISLSGTSFFSRILKVIRKVEVPPDYLVPSQPTTLKQLQPYYPQPYGKIPMPKPYTSSHLQWRRDQRSSGDDSLLTASSNGLGSSNSGE